MIQFLSFTTIHLQKKIIVFHKVKLQIKLKLKFLNQNIDSDIFQFDVAHLTYRSIGVKRKICNHHFHSAALQQAGKSIRINPDI